MGKARYKCLGITIIIIIIISAHHERKAWNPFNSGGIHRALFRSYVVWDALSHTISGVYFEAFWYRTE